MFSTMDVFTQVCTKPHEPPLIAPSRHKDVMTALKYLASAHGMTANKLEFTPELEGNYREKLHAYFDEHPKGQSTIRNTLQYLAQLWKAFHTINQTPPVPRQVPHVPSVRAVRKRLREEAPYRHLTWMQQHRYRISPEQWPVEMSTRWNAFTLLVAHDMRWVTLNRYQEIFISYLSYHLLSATDRMVALPDEANAMLAIKQAYAAARQEIMAPTIVTSWDELFEPARLNSYITWSAWRCWRWHDDILKEKEPHRPSTQGKKAAKTITYIAKRTEHPKYVELQRLVKKLPRPIKMHDKKDPRHRFELSELEAVALTLIAEARRMGSRPSHSGGYPGTGRALRFQMGLILQLIWRNPMRARNWCEALLGQNLKQDQGQWRWRFEGTEMKVGMRGTEVNVFEPDVPPEVAVHLEEFLSSYRPHLKNAASDRHVFLSKGGKPMTREVLLLRLQTHVKRHTGKNIYTHLFRSLFSTHHLSHGMDINSVAYAMNDTPQAVLNAYNELMADTHRPIIADANRQALANGHKPLTPPTIPITPKPRKTDPDQMNLI
jgi:integrase